MVGKPHTRVAALAPVSKANEEQEALGISEVSGFSGSDFFSEEFAFWQLHGGFRINSGTFSFRASVTAVPKGIATLNVGMGFVY